MTAAADNSWPNVDVSLEEGILTIRVHTAGGPAEYTPVLKKQLTEVLRRFGRDPEVRVMIVTGTGDTFVGSKQVGGQGGALQSLPGWRNTESNQFEFMRAILDVESPMISAVNGPVTIHPEFPAMCDIVLAAPGASFRDGHIPFGYVPGDGAHVVWPLLLGLNRARYFLWMGTVLTAQAAYELGVVHEIVDADRLMARAREIATELARLPVAVTRGTRLLFAHQIRQVVERDLGFGLVVEGIATVAGS
jgi:enoyl-CoA hydratase/carnithine racemase